MSRHATQRTRGFSLLEMLVVLMIVAVLTALLIPAVQKARAQANRTKCMSNIRQVGYGISIYVNDYREYPPAEALPQYQQDRGVTPVFFAARKSSLLAISQTKGFNRYYLSCPEGWASAGDSAFYEGRGMNKYGSAYMDYAYWGRRYTPTSPADLRTLSFPYSARDRKLKILATDVVSDLGSDHTKVTRAVGEGNHSSQRGGQPYKVPQRDAKGMQVGLNAFRSVGSSVLFNDYHVEWFKPDALMAQSQGICYPPPSEWK